MSLRDWLAGWLGDRGERAAVRFLKRQGLKIVGRRYRNRFGEIDIIAWDARKVPPSAGFAGRTLVFVEVKTRRSDVAGRPESAVTSKKQGAITRTAAAFLKKRRLEQQPTRFDVVAVIWADDSRVPEVRWFQNAFDAAD